MKLPLHGGASGYDEGGMTEYELFDLLAQNRELTSDTWYFFLAVHMAIFGIIHIASRRVHFYERLLLYIAYGGFMYVNYEAQADNYNTFVQLSRAAEALAQKTGDALALTVPDDMPWVIPYLPHVYLVAGALSVLVIFFTSHGRRRDETD